MKISLSENAAPLDELLNKGVLLNWTSVKLASFKGLKEDLMSMSVSMHFDPSLPLSLACEASDTGISFYVWH